MCLTCGQMFLVPAQLLQGPVNILSVVYLYPKHLAQGLSLKVGRPPVSGLSKPVVVDLQGGRGLCCPRRWPHLLGQAPGFTHCFQDVHGCRGSLWDPLPQTEEPRVTCWFILRFLWVSVFSSLDGDPTLPESPSADGNALHPHDGFITSD